jgi:hypothetical protein
MMTQLQLEPALSLMARGKKPIVSHTLPKERTLLDCFLEAQSERAKQRRSREQEVERPSADQALARHDAADQEVADRGATIMPIRPKQFET